MTFPTKINFLGPSNFSCKVWKFSNITKQYMWSLYFAALTLTTINNQPEPVLNGEFAYDLTVIISGKLFNNAHLFNIIMKTPKNPMLISDFFSRGQ